MLIKRGLPAVAEHTFESSVRICEAGFCHQPGERILEAPHLLEIKADVGPTLVAGFDFRSIAVELLQPLLKERVKWEAIIPGGRPQSSTRRYRKCSARPKLRFPPQWFLASAFRHRPRPSIIAFTIWSPQRDPMTSQLSNLSRNCH